MDTHLINIVIKLFREFYEDYPDSQVWSFTEEKLITEKDFELTSIFSEYISHGIFELDDLVVYKKYKRESKSYRNTYTVSLRNHMYLAYYTIKYYAEVHASTNNGMGFFTKNSSLKDFPLIKTYDFHPYEKLDYVEVDIEKFYPNLGINKISKVLPNGNSDSLEKISVFYDRMYAFAGDEFGLLQNNWYSWLLADLYLTEIDNEFLGKGLSFYRKGDKYCFFNKKNKNDIIYLVNKTFSKYGLSANMSKIKIIKKNIFNIFSQSLKHKITVFLFPISTYSKYVKNNKNIICRIIIEANENKLNIQKLINRLLSEMSWNDFELYHILQMAVVYNLKLNQYLPQLSKKYLNASLFLKSQIRLQFFKNADTESIIKLISATKIADVEIEDIKKTLVYLMWEEKKIEDLMNEIET